MEYTAYNESVDQNDAGKYFVSVRYERKGVVYNNTATVDNVSDAYALIRTFRAAFREQLENKKQERLAAAAGQVQYTNTF